LTAHISIKAIKLARIINNRSYASALLKGVAAGVEHERLLRFLNCRTIVDIGASRGQFALVARQCFPEVRIFSFEPLAEPCDRFRSIFSSDDKVSLFPLAIGPQSGEATIHVSGQDDSSSLLAIGKLQSELFPGTAEKRTEWVRIEPLHAILDESQIEAPAFLKLDVQGYELKALEGCEDLLDKFAYIYTECSFVELYEGQALAPKVIAWLQNHEFSLIGVYNMTYDKIGRAIQADFLFSSNAKEN